ncbi:universal stress protein [Conexibacter sp. JD483]|uniref:universal stress protein n=1 Tax=unclassified Conexibacter TaxID=2627773 RepID=UPI00271ADCDE|nr:MULTISPECIES: universal stress protein [unclassified Conexibacter]MDO8187777.1 universal stress protein [Conexibacter sp. CPCC 205706]MDO8201386.1 universal stress protein [Conexibacter sp. CPCC 205762]MDR9372712.1 universal stress protein [Conexibacter sp. JD483]
MTSMIVAGVDGLRGGRDAVALGAALAAADDAELLLTGVWQETLLPLPLLMSSGEPPLERTERMLLRTRAAQAPRAITRPLSGLSPARALCRVAASEHAGTIAIGSTAAAPAGHVRAGRDAQHVIHDAPCNAALAARGLHERPFAIGSIVVGVDGGAESEAALGVAARLAQGLGVALTAIAVHDPRPHARDGAEGIAEQAREHAGVTAAEVRHGDPATELARAAQEADLLVLGSRHGGHAARVTLGRVGHRLTTDAPCSLLLVPCAGPTLH